MVVLDNGIHVGLFYYFINNYSTGVYVLSSKLKGTEKGNSEEGQIVEFCGAKPTFKSEQDLTVR
ncbi:MAG: hypothetical protein IJR86_07305 [Bacteroidaceae bacterium]|nr:hypothetical protein [Bacteroidaceae bacterium]